MTSLYRRSFAAVLVAVIAASSFVLADARGRQAAATATLPTRISDGDFWKLTNDISEPGGYFRIADNFTSNESEVGRLVTMLKERGQTGGVYVGVGPEQNFSYISAIRPAMAFVIDIRRQAVMQHLMFKAMFELSKDRADFISLLFAKPRPAGLEATTAIQTMWDAYFKVLTSRELASSVHDRVIQQLTKTHKFTFTADEEAQLDAVMSAFVQFGPSISTRGSGSAGGGGGRSNNQTFADLTGWSSDSGGNPQSFLSTEEHFQIVKALHDRNLIVAVSGDFAGPKALRAIGAYAREHGSTITAYYLSNVEQYLFQEGKQGAFYDNVATLPLSSSSIFIRPYAMRRGGGVPLCAMAPFLKAFAASRVLSDSDAQMCTGG